MSSKNSVNTTASDPNTPIPAKDTPVAQQPSPPPLPKVPRVAKRSQQASQIRAAGDTGSTMNFVGAGILTMTALATIAVPPAAIAFAGLGILIQRVTTHVGMNIELRSNLMVIQHEVDRFYKIAKTMEAIAKENGIELNTGSVTNFVTKITAFIALLASDEVIQGIKEYRQSSTQNPNQAKYIDTKSNASVKSTWEGKFKRYFAPGEYLRQLVRDITILTVFMTILIGEFDILMRYKGDPSKQNWVNNEIFKSMLFDTMRFAGIPPKDINESEMAFIGRQLEGIETKRGKNVYANTRVKSFLNTQILNLKDRGTRRLPNQRLGKKKWWSPRGGGVENLSPQEHQAAAAFVENVANVANALAVDPELEEEIQEHKEAQQEEIAEAVEEEIKDAFVLGKTEALVEEQAEEIAKAVIKGQITPDQAETAANITAEKLSNQTQAQTGGKRRVTPTARWRRSKTQTRRKHRHNR